MPVAKQYGAECIYSEDRLMWLYIIIKTAPIFRVYSKADVKSRLSFLPKSHWADFAANRNFWINGGCITNFWIEAAGKKNGQPNQSSSPAIPLVVNPVCLVPSHAVFVARVYGMGRFIKLVHCILQISPSTVNSIVVTHFDPSGVWHCTLYKCSTLLWYLEHLLLPYNNNLNEP